MSKKQPVGIAPTTHGLPW